MKNTYTYFISVTPFHVLEKDSKKTLIVSEKGKYHKIDSAHLSDFKEGDYLFRSVLIGESFVQISYFKYDEKKMRKPAFNNGLERIFLSRN